MGVCCFANVKERRFKSQRKNAQHTRKKMHQKGLSKSCRGRGPRVASPWRERSWPVYDHVARKWRNWCSGFDKRIVVLFCTDMFVRKRHLWLFTMIDLLVRGLIPLRKESLARCSCGLINDFDNMIWYGHDVPDHSKCRSSMLNLLQQLDVAAPPVPQHASSNDDLPGHPGVTLWWSYHRLDVGPPPATSPTFFPKK